jgi:hypothetical protein
MEIWRKTPLTPDFIEVSSDGRVRTLDRVIPYIQDGNEFVQRRKGTVFSPFLGNNGYLYISCQHEGKRPKYLVHRLVASAFCDGFDPDLSVNHKDGIKINNMPSNLEWITIGENTAHQWKIGLVNLRGENHPSSKITDSDMFTIRKMLADGTRKAEIAESFRVSISLIYKIDQGKKRVHRSDR